MPPPPPGMDPSAGGPRRMAKRGLSDEREAVRARLEALEKQKRFLDRGGEVPAAKSPTAKTTASATTSSSPLRASVGPDSGAGVGLGTSPARSSSSAAADAKASAFLAAGRARTSPAAGRERRSSGYSDDFDESADDIIEEALSISDDMYKLQRSGTGE